MAWGELGSIVKGLLFLSICRKETRQERPFFVLKRTPKDQKKLTGMVIAVSCQLSIILLVDGLMEILVVASGYCAV